MEFSRRVLFRLTRTWASVPPILFGTRMYLPNDKNAKIWQDRPRRQGEGGPGSFPSPFARPASFPPAPAKGPKKNDENVRNIRSFVGFRPAGAGIGLPAANS